MLHFYHHLALKLRKFRGCLLFICLAASLCFIGLLVLAPVEFGQQWQLTSIVVAITSLVAYVISLLFDQPIAQVNPEHNLLHRIKIRLQQSFSYLLALLLSMIVLAVLFLGLRALMGIIRNLFFN